MSLEDFSKSDFYSAALREMDGSNQDLAKALGLLRLASEYGDLRADYAIATWYIHGNSLIERDERFGVSILKKLKDSNIAEAAFDLAVAYDFGKGVRKNERTAFSLYMRAALLGDRESCRQVSQFYDEGKIFPHDKALAKSWYIRSEETEESISPPYRVRLR